ncbi:MAG TPA: hypothetical protein VGB70_14725 [Allosphingosinicella sp.]
MKLATRTGWTKLQPLFSKLLIGRFPLIRNGWVAFPVLLRNRIAKQPQQVLYPVGTARLRLKTGSEQ